MAPGSYPNHNTKAFPINISIEKDKHIQKEVVLVHIRGIENKRQSNTHLIYLPGARTSRRWRRAAFRRAGGQNRVEWGPSSLPSLASASRPRSGRSKKCMLVTCYPLEQRTLNEPTARPRFDPPTHTPISVSKCFLKFIWYSAQQVTKCSLRELHMMHIL